MLGGASDPSGVELGGFEGFDGIAARGEGGHGSPIIGERHGGGALHSSAVSFAECAVVGDQERRRIWLAFHGAAELVFDLSLQLGIALLGQAVGCVHLLFGLTRGDLRNDGRVKLEAGLVGHLPRGW